MTPLRQHMIAALQLSGKGERTQQAYVREVRLLAQFYHKSPDRISEQELQYYFLHRKNVDSLAPASMRICYSGIRFFFRHVLKRDWHTLALIRAQTAHRLPAGALGDSYAPDCSCRSRVNTCLNVPLYFAQRRANI